MAIKQRIRTAEAQYLVRKAGSYQAWIAEQLDARWHGATPDWELQGQPLAAYVIRSSWVVTCPQCNETIIASDKAGFVCLQCQNTANGGKAHPVVFPPNREGIEYLLMKRPNPDTRNWVIGESVANLHFENIAHGVNTL